MRQVLSDERTIVIYQTPVHDVVPVLIFGDRRKTDPSWRQLSGLEVTLEPGDKFVVDGDMGPNKQGNGRSIGVSLGKPKMIAQLAGASKITLSHQDLGTVSVDIRSPAVAVRGIQACADRKSREWGVDAEKLASLQSPPIPLSSPASWFSSDDFPTFALGGFVVVKLDVGTDGRVKACSVVNQQATIEFHTSVCQGFMKRGRFKPATDATGQPTVAPFVQQVLFERVPKQ